MEGPLSPDVQKALAKLVKAMERDPGTPTLCLLVYDREANAMMILSQEEEPQVLLEVLDAARVRVATGAYKRFRRRVNA